MSITFRADNIKKILEGRKTQTRRRSRYQLKVGRVYGIKDNWFSNPAACVRITRRFKQRLGDISPEDVRKEGYDSFEDFQAAWIKLHASWKSNDVITVYEFELWKRNGRRQARINNPIQNDAKEEGAYEILQKNGSISECC
jgi:hypothetical protein